MMEERVKEEKEKGSKERKEMQEQIKYFKTEIKMAAEKLARFNT